MKHHGEYPANWKQLAECVKDLARWRCIRCNHHHCPREGFTLTVHHMDGNKSNVQWWNLLALCQRCHLSIQGRVDPNVPYLFEHSEWIKPYVAGFYADKYLGEKLPREIAVARMKELLELECVA